MTVACVLRSGGVYTLDWVERLGVQVGRHLPGARFVCMTDTFPAPNWRPRRSIEFTGLRHDWPGWWAKLCLFAPGVFVEGELVLYLDLDSVVVDDLRSLFEYSGDFATLTDFYEPGLAASGVMLWRAGTVPLYEIALETPPAMTSDRSDRWWNQFVTPDRLQELFPGMFGSYKAHELEDGPGDFAVCCMHGEPKQHQLAATWVDTVWRGR